MPIPIIILQAFFFHCTIVRSMFPLNCSLREKQKFTEFNWFRYFGQMVRQINMPNWLLAGHVSTIHMSGQTETDQNHWYWLKKPEVLQFTCFSAGFYRCLFPTSIWDNNMFRQFKPPWIQKYFISCPRVQIEQSHDSQQEFAFWCKLLLQLVDKGFKVPLIAFTSCRSQPPLQPLTVMIMQLDQWAKL